MAVMALTSVRRLFGIQNVGDLTLNYVQILLYLESHRKGERPSSPEKLAHELGIAELTVVRGYESLLKHKFIVVAKDVPPSYQYEIRDPNNFTVTALGRKALRPFLSSFGFLEVALTGILMLGLGIMLGLIYSAYELYPFYLEALSIITVAIVGAIAALLAYLVRMARETRRNQLSIALRKE